MASRVASTLTQLPAPIRYCQLPWASSTAVTAMASGALVAGVRSPSVIEPSGTIPATVSPAEAVSSSAIEVRVAWAADCASCRISLPDNARS